MTPRLLIYAQPSSELEAKFSMPFCAAAAVVFGHPTIDTFDVPRIRDPRVQALMTRVTMRANPAFDAAAPLSQARVSVRLRDGRTVADRADGARGYPGRLSDEELADEVPGLRPAVADEGRGRPGVRRPARHRRRGECANADGALRELITRRRRHGASMRPLLFSSGNVCEPADARSRGVAFAESCATGGASRGPTSGDPANSVSLSRTYMVCVAWHAARPRFPAFDTA